MGGSARAIETRDGVRLRGISPRSRSRPVLRRKVIRAASDRLFLNHLFSILVCRVAETQRFLTGNHEAGVKDQSAEISASGLEPAMLQLEHMAQLDIGVGDLMIQ